MGIKLPLEYLQIYVTTIDSLLFITMMVKLYLFLCFLSNYHNYFLACAKIIISGNLLASTLCDCIHSFSAHYRALQTEKSMKSISRINPAIMENMHLFNSNIDVSCIQYLLKESTKNSKHAMTLFLRVCRLVTCKFHPLFV